MPTADGAGKLVVPYQPFGDIHEEYVTCCARADGRYQPLGLEQARKIWSSSPVLHHVKLARPKLNFQRCSTCVGLETAIRSAARKGNRYPNKNSNPNPNPNPNPDLNPNPNLNPTGMSSDRSTTRDGAISNCRWKRGASTISVAGGKPHSLTMVYPHCYHPLIPTLTCTGLNSQEATVSPLFWISGMHPPR